MTEHTAVAYGVRAMLASLLLGSTAGAAMHQAPARPVDEQPLGPVVVAAAPAPPAAGELQAVFMEVKGNVQWRLGETQPWQSAQVDQVLDRGAQIRTGRSSSASLRLGKNASVVVASLTSISLAELVERDGSLRTRVGLLHGKTDFKVDHVGLANDFEVLTPTSVISVRGTGYSVEWGALDGAMVNSYDGNTARAVEVRYFNSGRLFGLGANAASNDRKPDPVVLAMYNTIGPPPLTPSGTDGSNSEETAEQGVEQDRFVASTQNLQQSLTREGAFTAFAGGVEIAMFLASQVPPTAVSPPFAPENQPPDLPPPPLLGQFLQAPNLSQIPVGASQYGKPKGPYK